MLQQKEKKKKREKNNKPKEKTKNSRPFIPKVTDTGQLVYGSYITIF